jgi:cation transport protein ChaC
MKPNINFVHMSPEEKQQSLLETRAGRPSDEPMWIFGFGSLMWNPCFDYDIKTAAVLKGYDRKFHIWTTRARGTPDNPGLGLCLEDCAGACRGVAFRLVEGDVEAAWERLWEREMGSGIYRPVWVSLESEDHDRIVALTFVVNREHPHYAGPMPSERMADIMAGAKGSYGLCRDYLAGTIEEMRKLDVSDSDLEELLSRVDAIEGRAE